MTNKTIWINTKHLEETASITYTFTLSLAPQSDIISVHGKADTDTVKALHVDYLPDDDAFKRKSRVRSPTSDTTWVEKHSYATVLWIQELAIKCSTLSPMIILQYLNLSKSHCKTIRHMSPCQKPMQVLGPVTVFHKQHMYMLVIVSEISSSIYPN
jgi:hypothetical protein